MKSHPKTSDEYSTFENALKTVVSVPRDEIQRREDEYQRERKQLKKKRAKTSPASRVSRDKD
jgi:hypothetical protein